MRAASGRAVGQRPEGRHDDHLGAVGDQRPEGLGEGEVPADQQADLAEGRVNRGVRGVQRRRQVRPLRVPEVLLRVLARDGPGVGYECADVDELAVVLLDDCAGDD